MGIHVKNVDPRVKRTRQLLQQAFMELFQENGFSAITVQDIAERATVNRATFYAHFEDKYALMDSLMREQFQNAIMSTLPLPAIFRASTLRALIEAVFDYLAQLNSHCKPSDKQFDPFLEKAVQQELSNILLTWLQQGKTSDGRQHVPVEITAEVMSWAIFGVAFQWSRGEMSVPTEQMVSFVLAVLTAGAAGVTPGLLPE
jgi:AcrR family transcriptional regulator